MILPNTPKEEERRGGLLGFFDKAVTPSERSGLSPVTALAAGLDALILPEMRMGDAIRQQGAQRAKGMAANRTAETLRAQGREDLAKLLLDGGINAQQAISMMQSDKAADLAFQRQQILAAGKTKDTALMRRAVAAGLKPGSDEYKKFMLTGGDTYAPGAPVEFGTLDKGTMMVQGRDEQGNITYKVVPIPGSQAAADVEQAAFAKKAGTSAKVTSGTTVLGDISEMKSQIQESPYLTTGPVATVLKKFGYTKAIDVEQLGETIRSNIGFDRLQRMRDESPTGGALGQVAVQELNALQASLGSLSTAQSAGQLVRNLERLEEQYKKSMQRILNTEGGSSYFTQGQIDAITASTPSGTQSIETEDGTYIIKEKTE